MLAELTTRGLSMLDEPVTISADPVGGFPVISIGRRITSGDVADALDDE